MVIFAALINLLSRYMLGELRRLDKRGGYYIAEDSTARGSGKILNACVPILPAPNAVVVIKSLLQALGDRELEAVLRHEEGHIRSRRPLFITTALAAFYFTYHNVDKALDAYLGSSVLHLSAGLAFGFTLGVLYINTTLRGLERKADHYATAHGYSEELKKALSRLPERSGLLSRLPDPHPIRRARAGAIEGFEAPSWHVKVIAAPVFLMSLTFAAHLAQRLADRTGIAVITLGLALMLTVFISSGVHSVCGARAKGCASVIRTEFATALVIVARSLG